MPTPSKVRIKESSDEKDEILNREVLSPTGGDNEVNGRVGTESKTQTLRDGLGIDSVASMPTRTDKVAAPKEDAVESGVTDVSTLVLPSKKNNKRIGSSATRVMPSRGVKTTAQNLISTQPTKRNKTNLVIRKTWKKF